ncbi:beta-ketoacyl-[acyl-carrier-protein] synthase family protein [Pedobacter sp. Du54]|uniref:beta-ketoacyl-[acyl-carrier-protein] synthase family protein n=1 Tax=Pedobacter anseongensis TaxID=3133439 RepID=UPI00309E3972
MEKLNNRVVITGLGVVAPNGINLTDFTYAIKNGISGIKHSQQLAALNFSCQISGEPTLTEAHISKYFSALELKNLNSTGIVYGVIAGLDAWKDAGLEIATTEPDWERGTIFGAGTSGLEKFKAGAEMIDLGLVRKIGSGTVIQTMASGISAFISGKLGLGNQVSTNSSACTTGTESILMAYERIKNGYASIMLAGSTSDSGPYIWGGFDAIKVCTYKHNSEPEKGSRPMSATASGFVPSAGAGALVLESLENALNRGAKIYAEVLGGNLNSGGQLGLGSMTAPNPIAVQRCITQAIANAGIKADAIDTINGHLTATSKDALEIENWATALNRFGDDFPFINSIKSMIGHSLSATGSIECIASVLQLEGGFIFPNINCEDLHPEIEKIISRNSIPTALIHKPISILAKANFGFGDVNACIIFKKYTGE